MRCVHSTKDDELFAYIVTFSRINIGIVQKYGMLKREDSLFSSRRLRDTDDDDDVNLPALI